jgi:hypothetical protein
VVSSSSCHATRSTGGTACAGRRPVRKPAKHEQCSAPYFSSNQSIATCSTLAAPTAASSNQSSTITCSSLPSVWLDEDSHHSEEEQANYIPNTSILGNNSNCNSKAAAVDSRMGSLTDEAFLSKTTSSYNNNNTPLFLLGLGGGAYDQEENEDDPVVQQERTMPKEKYQQEPPLVRIVAVPDDRKPPAVPTTTTTTTKPRKNNKSHRGQEEDPALIGLIIRFDPTSEMLSSLLPLTSSFHRGGSSNSSGSGSGGSDNNFNSSSTIPNFRKQLRELQQMDAQNNNVQLLLCGPGAQSGKRQHGTDKDSCSAGSGATATSSLEEEPFLHWVFSAEDDAEFQTTPESHHSQAKDVTATSLEDEKDAEKQLLQEEEEAFATAAQAHEIVSKDNSIIDWGGLELEPGAVGVFHPEEQNEQEKDSDSVASSGSEIEIVFYQCEHDDDNEEEDDIDAKLWSDSSSSGEDEDDDDSYYTPDRSYESYEWVLPDHLLEMEEEIMALAASGFAPAGSTATTCNPLSHSHSNPQVNSSTAVTPPRPAPSSEDNHENNTNHSYTTVTPPRLTPFAEVNHKKNTTPDSYTTHTLTESESSSPRRTTTSSLVTNYHLMEGNELDYYGHDDEDQEDADTVLSSGSNASDVVQHLVDLCKHERLQVLEEPLLCRWIDFSSFR